MTMQQVSAFAYDGVSDEVSEIRHRCEDPTPELLEDSSPPARQGKDLIAATRPYAVERRALSWWYLCSALGLLLAGQAVVILAPWWPLKVAGSVLVGLLLLRLFILYHDYMHHALLRRSKLARLMMHAYGYLILAPPRIWKRSHDYHHANTAKMVGSQIGSFPTMSAAMFERLPPLKRLAYRIARHPLTMLFGFFTVFVWGMCAGPFLRKPRDNAGGAAALVLYAAFGGLVSWLFGWPMWIMAVVLPHFIAAAIGSYMFYAQHNFPDIKLRSRHEWSYTDAALHAASYMKMGPLMQWFSGNIGYHHVHHLNPSIPFYNLPAAMAGIPELQQPGETSLSLSDIAACVRLKLWDGNRDRMVGFD